MTWIYPLVTLVSVLAACVAWVAKLRWAREFAWAKDEVIRAKDAQLETLRAQLAGLRDMTPMRVREYYVSNTAQLEEYNEALRQQLASARVELSRRDAQIERLVSASGPNSTEVASFVAARNNLQYAVTSLALRLAKPHPKNGPDFHRDEQEYARTTVLDTLGYYYLLRDLTSESPASDDILRKAQELLAAALCPRTDDQSSSVRDHQKAAELLARGIADDDRSD